MSRERLSSSLWSSYDTAESEGIPALKRLFEIAHGNSHQPTIVARFLLSLYNGERFPFSLPDLRRLDADIFADCLSVLLMDYRPRMEVHRYFENGGDLWEGMASKRGFKSHGDKSWR